MTLPDERYRAVRMAEQLLKDLCDHTITPRVPKIIRQRASGCLRHTPHVFQERMEPVTRLFKQYEQSKNES